MWPARRLWLGPVAIPHRLDGRSGKVNKSMRSQKGSKMKNPLVIGGLIAGTVDIGSACVIYKTNPVVITQAIAEGVLGSASFDEGLPSAALGLLLQWGMSIVIAFLCAAANARVAYLKSHWIVAGIVYGAVTFVVMNYVVVPLSRVGRSPSFSTSGLIENLVAVIVFCLIITYVTRQRSRGAPRA